MPESEWDPKKLVHNPEVESGRWVTPYHEIPDQYHSGWKPFSRLSTDYRLLNGRFVPQDPGHTKALEKRITPLSDLEGEAFRELRYPHYPGLEVVYVSHGSIPLKTPFWGRDKVDFKRVLRGNMFQQESWMYKNLNDPRSQLMAKDAFWTFIWNVKSLNPQGTLIEPLDVLMILGHPFYFFKPDDPEKPVGHDLYRIHLTLTVGEYIPGLREYMLDYSGIDNDNEFVKKARSGKVDMDAIIASLRE